MINLIQRWMYAIILIAIITFILYVGWLLRKADTVEEPEEDRGCLNGQLPMRNRDWIRWYEYRCRFYPMRDCPGWDTGGVCQRIGVIIAEAEDE